LSEIFSYLLLDFCFSYFQEQQFFYGLPSFLLESFLIAFALNLVISFPIFLAEALTAPPAGIHFHYHF